MIWKCLTKRSNTAEEREVCFKWFEELMGEVSGPDLDPKCFRTFFESNLIKLDPDLITESFKRCA